MKPYLIGLGALVMAGLALAGAVSLTGPNVILCPPEHQGGMGSMYTMTAVGTLVTQPGDINNGKPAAKYESGDSVVFVVDKDQNGHLSGWEVDEAIREDGSEVDCDPVGNRGTFDTDEPGAPEGPDVPRLPGDWADIPGLVTHFPELDGSVQMDGQFMWDPDLDCEDQQDAHDEYWCCVWDCAAVDLDCLEDCAEVD